LNCSKVCKRLFYRRFCISTPRDFEHFAQVGSSAQKAAG
jgi:hypothetical protein